MENTGECILSTKIKPKLLNPQDWLKLQLIVEGKEGKPEVTTRFAGQSRADEEPRNQ